MAHDVLFPYVVHAKTPQINFGFKANTKTIMEYMLACNRNDSVFELIFWSYQIMRLSLTA
ncbi:unnamed protein product [Arabidopsis thaliana]|uniref:Uncharacterized protein n=1 Tax=Arabidopsis thaliana TaxID=3702 RepID=A0A5S9XHM1_ARATH|nr:unnamed protein product [Arabidopsis thaliana]